MGKKIALVQCAASAASTIWVFLGQGPSSKVSTTSPSRRKSWVLKCSKPKPGPPVVSISTTRDTPSALGLPGHDDAAGALGGAADTCAGGAAVIGATRGAASAGEFCETTIGAVADGSAVGLIALAASGAVTLSSSTVVTTARLLPSVAAAASDVEGMGTPEDRCERMAPNTATHMIMTSAHAIAASR